MEDESDVKRKKRFVIQWLLWILPILKIETIANR